jgi:phage regulator Rha-like protein
MKTKIVHVKKNEVLTTSKLVAEMLEVPHRDLLRTIEKIVFRNENNAHTSTLKFPQKFIESTFLNKMGRSYSMYEMNEQAYMKLAMHLKGYDKAEQVQDSIIEAFYLMKRALLNHQNATWLNARESGKEIRAIETCTIKEFVDYATDQGSKNAKFYYSNVTKMTNKALELLIQVKDGKPLRELATIMELGFIQVVENRAQQVLNYGMDNKLPYKFIYQEAKKQVNELVDSLNFKPKKIK